MWDTTVAAGVLGLPFVGVHTSIGAIAPAHVACEHRRIDDALADERASLFARHGAEVPEYRRFEAVSGFLDILWTVPEFLFQPEDCPAGAELVGVSLPRQPRGGQEADWASMPE